MKPFHVAAVALFASITYIGQGLPRPLEDLEPGPLPAGERMVRIRSTTQPLSGPVVLLHARDERVSGQYIDHRDEGPFGNRLRERYSVRDWIVWAKERYGCTAQRIGRIFVCRPAYARGEPDWPRIMRDFEGLLSTAAPPGTPPTDVVCTDGSSWELQYRTSTGRRIERPTRCWAVEPARRAFEARIDSVFWGIVLKVRVAPPPPDSGR